jgi:hypothetical protein
MFFANTMIFIFAYAHILHGGDMNSVSKRLNGIVRDIKSIASELWDSAAESGFCCGIRLANYSRERHMPTPASCCGVRL